MDYKQIEDEIAVFFSGQSCLTELMARELAALAVSVFQRHELRGKLRGAYTNPQTHEVIEAVVAKQNLKAARTAVRCGEAVQFIDFNKE